MIDWKTGLLLAVALILGGLLILLITSMLPEQQLWDDAMHAFRCLTTLDKA